MADDPQPPHPTASPFAGLRKVIFIFGVVFVIWIFLGQLAPRLFFPHVAQPPAVAMQRPPTAPAPAENDDRIAALNDRITQLEAKTKTLEDTIAALPKTQPEAPPIDNARVTHVEEELGNVKAQVGDIEARSTQRLSALTAFHALKDAATRGEPFGSQLNQLGQLTQGNASAQDIIKKLTPAASGVLTLAELQRRFETAVPQALSTGQGFSPDPQPQFAHSHP